MTTIGDAAMLEQFHPTDLLVWCERAESAGFTAGFMVSEHFHPWTPQQGQSAFAWSFLGALGERTSLRFGTAVTCPGFRYHPAVLAHAAATLGAMYPRRFWLGLGAGEALNEHVVGGPWPEIGVRSAMLFEAIEVIGSWARTDEEAIDNAVREWPNGGMPFPKQDILSPEDFAAMAKLVRPEDFRNRVLMSADLRRHVAHIQHYVDMGFDEIHLHNVGRNQAEFIDVFGREVLPELILDRVVRSVGSAVAV